MPTLPPPAPPLPRYHTPTRYHDRASKAEYIARKYAPIWVETPTCRVLDVGCDQRQLARHLPANVRYTGVDVNDAADVVLNLERDDLPFPDASFECVLACDVLEHLDRIHAVFDELCRVSASRVIVSLPNPLRAMLMELAGGSEGRLKYYGLPADPPRDRHKWFFGSDEAEEFLRVRAARLGFEVEQMDHEDSGGPAWPARDGRDRLASSNCRGGTLWCVLRRTLPPIRAAVDSPTGLPGPNHIAEPIDR